MALPTVKAVGRLGITVSDGIDADDEPEIAWCDEGEVWLTPTITFAQYPEGTPVSPMLGNSVTKLVVDSEGYLTYRGLRYVKVFDLTSDEFNPHVASGKATHNVQFKGVKRDGVEVRFVDAPIRIAADAADPVTGEFNITRQLPVPVGGGVAIVIGPPGPPGDPTLTDQVTAANLATGTATRAALAAAAAGLGLGGSVDPAEVETIVGDYLTEHPRAISDVTGLATELAKAVRAGGTSFRIFTHDSAIGAPTGIVDGDYVIKPLA